MANNANTLEALGLQLKTFIAEKEADATPIWLVGSLEDGTLDQLSEGQRAWVESQNWQPAAGATLVLPGENGAIGGVLLGTGGEGWEKDKPFLPGGLPGSLPSGDYAFASDLPDPELASLAWLAGCYRFTRYKADQTKPARLKLPEGADPDKVTALAQATYFGRDLINTPANDLGPAELETAVRDLGHTFGASVKVTEGRDLLADNFPMIHAVGRASDRPPRLIDLTWGKPDAPKLTIVGKGICFDTGGLNMKPGSGMLLMKKDMGGAAAALATAFLVMQADLPVRLRVLIPAADNNISGNAFRPGDVLQSRSGKTVEIGNTDAEGRLVLADALALADEEEPDYLITFATLTGAARSALGPDLPPLYSDDDDFAQALLEAGTKTGDPVWRMPFWNPYDEWLKSSIADVNHISQGPFAGSITAALFLRRFVEKAKRFAHFDIYGWVPRPTPGRPQGGEPHGARALFAFLQKTFGKAEG
ncbi:leucyl aminopeptidase family protein [Methyloligella solikamskensis]|uniref:Leucyl aminopeptidase family protein n=1 Tax=Methyloligella solikamskensis TaxID=1177756 RepID=A0ABW3JE96_9HYPH